MFALRYFGLDEAARNNVIAQMQRLKQARDEYIAASRAVDSALRDDNLARLRALKGEADGADTTTLADAGTDTPVTSNPWYRQIAAKFRRAVGM